ncbi:MAG TPA: hypothetical protein VMZ32_04345 [Gammaproteobacteria bacterium]|nr:hypothetical protein [Gammaproteobacteria bacterium]
MIIEKGDKVHLVYRALYENSTRRHFLGEVLEVESAVCRLEGFTFIYDNKSAEYQRKPERRTTIVDLGESGYIVNIIDSRVKLENVTYRYLRDAGLMVCDGAGFTLDINEFSFRS